MAGSLQCARAHRRGGSADPPSLLDHRSPLIIAAAAEHSITCTRPMVATCHYNRGSRLSGRRGRYQSD
jgi:hypothetical protein